MNHIEEHITAYIHGEFSDEDRQRISNHLIDCSSCQRRYKEIVEVQQKINLIEPLSVSPHFSTEVMRCIELVKSAESQADWILEEMQEMEEEGKVSFASPFPWYVVSSAMLIMGVFFMHREMHPERQLREDAFANNESVLEEPWKVTTEKEDVDLPELEPQPLDKSELAALLKEWGIVSTSHDFELPEIVDTDKPIQESFDRPWPEETKKEIVEVPENMINEKIMLDDGVDTTIKSAIDVNKKASKKVSRTGINYKVPAYWLYKKFNQDGSIGKGSDYHVILSSTLGAVLLHRRYKEVLLKKKDYIEGSRHRLELDLIEKQQLSTVNYLKNLSFDKGVGQDLYQHAQITSFLCLLVEEGQKKLLSSVDKALGFLIEQQNRDGGWDFKVRGPNEAFTSSNTLATGWAVLALNEARRLKGLKIKRKIMPSIGRSQSFLNRMIDSRNGQCGFKMRGDGQHVALCTVMATMARYAVKKPKRLKRTTEFTKNWVNSGMEREKRMFPYRSDYDFIWFSRLFSEAIEESENWDKSTDNLLRVISEKLPNSVWGELPKTARQLFLEIIKK